jgi:1-acyl-sn-glycerol-3-phosphate acyltransferase
MALVRSILTYLLASLYTLIVGTFALVIVVPFRMKGVLYALGHAGVGLALTTAGIRYRVVGRENVPVGRAVVFCANHQSNVDPPVLFQALHRRLHILYKAELGKLPVLGRVLEAGDFVPVQRDNRDAAFASIEGAVASIRGGNSFLIFPEGTRSKTDELLPFKKGGLVMAIKAQAPIMPVAIMGGRAAMTKGSAVIRPVRVTVRIGKPIETAGLTTDDRDELIARVRHAIEELLREGPVF